MRCFYFFLVVKPSCVISPQLCFFRKKSITKKPINSGLNLSYELSFDLVGMRGFEPPTSSTPCWRDTWLRYIPEGITFYDL